jgi:fatty acid desaturase
MQACSHAEARRLVSNGREAAVADLHVLDDGRRWLDLGFTLLLWTMGAALSCWAWAHGQGWHRWALAALGWVPSAVAMNAHILLVHEGMHGVLFRGRGLNRWAGALLAHSVLMSSSAYQVMHLRHHAFLGQAGDPDEYNNYAKPGPRLWALHCLRLALGSYLYLALIPSLSWPKARAAERSRMVQDYALLALLLAVLIHWVPFWILAQAWLLPLVLVNFMMNTRGLTQHSLSNAQDAFLASRSIRSGRLVRLCLLNENYHLAHHLYPRVPSYRLHRLHQLIHDRYPRELAGPGFLWFVGRFGVALWRGEDRPIGVVAGPGAGA